MNLAHPFTISGSGVKSPAATSQRLHRISTYATGMLLGCFGLFMMALVGFSAYGWMHADTVYAGTTLSGVDVGGMTRDEVAAVVDAEFQDLASTTVTFSDGTNEYPVTASDLGIALDRDGTIDRVMNHGRTGSPWDRSLVWTRSWLDGSDVDPVMLVDDGAFSDAMEILAPSVIFAPQDARVDLNATGGATLVPDVSGRSLNVTATRDRVVSYLANPNDSTVALGLVSLPAGVLASDIEAGLPGAERAMAATIKIEADEGTWGLSRTMLTSVVSVGGDGELNIDRDQIQAFVQGIADQVNHPSENADVVIDENGAIVVVPQVNAATVDVDATTEALVKAVGAGETSVDLVVERSEPAIVDATAQEWADSAEALVADGLALSWRGGESQLGRADLVSAMVITQTPDDDEPFVIEFDRGLLGATLAPLQDELDVPVREAKFRLIDGEVRFQEEARQGREVDVDATVDAIVQTTMDGGDEAPVTLNTLEPTYTGDDRDSISLNDVLGTSQTYYGTSSEPRRHNVERAVELEDGWLIPPDGVFSYAEIMGLVDEANDFVTGFGIVADPNGGVVTAPVIGGGICQVSTTIYQAAFWAGLKIEERWSHPYWIESYGQAPYGMLGLDSMVNIEPGWALDLKFRNTTENWIALVMVADGENVRAEILGVDQGWQIEVPEPQITNVVRPEEGMVYTDTPELPKGQELHVEHAREGFTSTIVRTVRDADGNVIDEYSYSSDFSASRDRTLRGTGGGEN